MKMKALRWYGIHDVRAEEIDKPVPAAGEVLVRVLYAGICGSDLHIYNKGMFIQNIPETMGHEFCGVVEEAFEGSGFAPGDCVIANPMVPCGTCESCLRGSFNTCENLGFIGEVRQGCFTGYIALPADRLIRVCADADMKQMALAEPLAVAVNICKRASLKPDDSLAIIGAGPIGLLTAAVAHSVYGLQDITVVNRSETRRRIAEKLGARALAAIPQGQHFDKVVESAGSPSTLQIALESVRANGTVLVVSVFEENVTIDANILVCSQITLIGCNCYDREDLVTAADLIASGRVDVSPIITDVFPVEEGKTAFEKLCAREKQAAKILLQP